MTHLKIHKLKSDGLRSGNSGCHSTGALRPSQIQYLG